MFALLQHGIMNYLSKDAGMGEWRQLFRQKNLKLHGLDG